MRAYLIPLAAALWLAGGHLASAKIAITVDKDAQQMTVAVDGVERYRWPVSTGNPSHETPNGSFRAFRMEEDHYSKEFDEAPMPHSIFFTKAGHAIHGTDSVGRLGSPASHGCVRLSRANASTLYALVQSDGVLNTTVTLTGSSLVALARNPKPKAAVASRRAPVVTDDDAGAGQPVELSPPARQVAPRLAADGYIYPADGASTEQRYPAPRGYRRYSDSEAAAPPQYAAPGGYGYAPQVYAPRGYYQPRGYYAYPD